MGATSHKRNGIKLIDELRTVNKTKWLIRKPVGDQHHTFLLGTNRNNYPDWQPHEFYHLDSAQGAAILDVVSHSVNERFERDNQRLPGLEL